MSPLLSQGRICDLPALCRMKAILYSFILFFIFSAPERLIAQSFHLKTDVAGISNNGVRDLNGVSVADYDGDGDLDIYMVSYWQYSELLPRTWNRLFQNQGDGTFLDVTDEAGVHSKVSGYDRGGMGNKFGASWGDYDNDGDPDLFLTQIGPNILYKNNGDGTFTEVTREAGLFLDDPGHASSSLWWDFDIDGDLDLYVSVWGGPDRSNYFYENMGDGTFADITALTGTGDAGYTWTTVPIDGNNDGLFDLYVVNDFGANTFYVNQGDKTFSEATAEFGLEDEGHGMGVTTGDYNNDGFFDIYLTNIAEHYPNPLFLNTGTGSFVNKAEELNVHDAGWAWGTEFFDCDNDGDLDLYVANGFLVEPGTNHLFTNQLVEQNVPTFQDVSSASGTNGGAEARGLVVFDYDNDGDKDMLVANWREAPYLYTNEGASKNWLKIELEGTRSNRNGVGSMVKLTTPLGKIAYRLYTGVDFLGQSIQPIHFGLGGEREVSELEVTWPNGSIDRVELIPANQSIRIREGQGLFTTTSTEVPDVNAGFLVRNIYPNPFQSSATITVNVPASGSISVELFNLLGQELFAIAPRSVTAGEHTLKLSPEDQLPYSGLYLYRVTYDTHVLTGTVVYVR